MKAFRPPVQGRKVRLAAAGCGCIAQNHFEAIARYAADAELVDVCDILPEALAAATEKTGARGHAELASILADTQADCVVSTTTRGHYARKATDVAGAGLAS